MERLAPTAMILLSLVSATIYAGCLDWRRAIYWTAAAVLTAAVTF